jgi:RNA polymerase sigma-70 factor, ECF subfamily
MFSPCRNTNCLLVMMIRITIPKKFAATKSFIRAAGERIMCHEMPYPDKLLHSINDSPAYLCMVGWEGTQILEKATEAQLCDMLARSALGDQLAFAEIVRQHQGMVFSLACHFLRDRWLAEELAQEVFLNLHQNLSAIKSPAHLTFWLRKVTCHRSIDAVRRQKVRPQVSLDDVPEPTAAADESDFMLSETLRRVVDTLPEKARMVIILRYQEDLEPAEISKVLAMPVNTVKSHLRRSLSMLRDKLSRQLGEVQV